MAAVVVVPVSKRKMTQEDEEYQEGIVEALGAAPNMNVVASHIARVFRMAEHGIVPDTKTFWAPIKTMVRSRYNRYYVRKVEAMAHRINRRRGMGALGRWR